jgi:phenylalanyl-tRNA synthetase beta chain
MKISYNWLQEYFEEKLPAPEVLAELITMHSFEIDSINKSENDAILDMKVMPDRAHDCMSYWGIAKEVGTLTGLDVKPMIFPVEGDEAVTTSKLIKLKIEDENKCRRAMKRVAIGVEIGPSPLWLKNRLESVGQRSINNIVDIANFVMLETGQPVHTFDLAKIKGEINIRSAKPGEKVKTLDGKEFTLDESMLVIADDEKALDIAGVKGGANSGITDDTQNVLLSACNFDPIMIRQTSKKLGLRTDASERFEKEISPALAEIAMDYLSFLVKEIAGGYLASDVLDFYPNKKEAPGIHISEDEINKLLGIKIKGKEIEEIFSKLRFEFEKKKDSYVVTPPIERLDINMKEDIAEEIGRIYGYEKIPAVVPVDTEIKAHDGNFLKIAQARQQLLSEGYSEVYTYTFQNKGKIELANPLAEDKKYLRSNLTDGLKESINLNIKNIALLDADEVKVFEVGTVFTKDSEQINVAYGDKKEVKEMKLEEYIKDIPKDLEFKQSDKDVKYRPISIYPFILRDIAVWVPENENPDKLLNIIKDNATELLAREPKLFDKFSKEGRTSYAYRLVFQSEKATLTDEEINKIMSKISSEISSNSLWQIR